MVRKLIGSNTFWVGVVSTGALALTFLFAHSHLGGPPCLFRMMVGLPCPGCGLTRSMQAIWRGDLLTAVRYHPLGIPVMVGCWALMIGSACALIWPRHRERIVRMGRAAGGTRFMWVVLVLMMATWAVRLADALTGRRIFLW